MDDSFALLLLSELPRVGERVLRRLVQRALETNRRVAVLLAEPEHVLAYDYGLPEVAVRRLVEDRARHEAHCRVLCDWLREAGVMLAHPAHPSYPSRRLSREVDRPPFLYLYGESALLEHPTLAILNSRDLTEQSVAATVQIARQTAREGFTLITGGMKATHRIAATTVRAMGAPRVIVLDRGIGTAFGDWMDRDPFGLGPGRARLDRQRTLVVSPFRPHDHAVPRNGRRRDEIVAALGDVVVAVRGRSGGEIERICLRALDAGRCVLSWQGENATLVAAGATPIDDVDLRAGLRRFLADCGR
jgi:predicted Rossmann fold nucleotide-binding protein DprA/Smf involved in DNA uptake